MKYVFYKGSVREKDKCGLETNNRAFNYGDGIFETIKVRNGRILFFSSHFQRITEGCKGLQLNLPLDFQNALHENIETLLEKNNLSGNARIRLEIFRKSGGYYTPESNEVEILISAESLDSNYVLNEKGYRIEIFPTLKKQINLLSNLKTVNGLLFVMAGLYKKEKGLDECLILNDFGNIAETISANIFMIKDTDCFTPALTEGCIAGVMRRNVIQLLKAEKINVYECPLLPEDLLLADEVFLTNVIQGVSWVGAYKQKRYFNTTSRSLINRLNQL